MAARGLTGIRRCGRGGAKTSPLSVLSTLRKRGRVRSMACAAGWSGRWAAFLGASVCSIILSRRVLTTMPSYSSSDELSASSPGGLLRAKGAGSLGFGAGRPGLLQSAGTSRVAGGAFGGFAAGTTGGCPHGGRGGPASVGHRAGGAHVVDSGTTMIHTPVTCWARSRRQV